MNYKLLCLKLPTQRSSKTKQIDTEQPQYKAGVYFLVQTDVATAKLSQTFFRQWLPRGSLV